MIKLGTVMDYSTHKKNLPTELQEAILQNLSILDDCYGVQRDIDKDDGGYVLLLETEQDVIRLIHDGQIDFSYHVPEWVDFYVSAAGERYAMAMYLLSNDFSIVISAKESILRLLPHVMD